MTVILASIDVSAFAPLQIAFRRAVATTAQVDISAVSVNSYNNHVAPSSFRRLLSFRHLLSTSTEVSFFIQATDYQTASAIGIRLQPVYMTEDLTSEGLPPATILSGPLFLGHDANLLTCVGCPEGQYLDGACRECPDFSSTQPRINAADVTFCVCEPGYTNTTGDACLRRLRRPTMSWLQHKLSTEDTLAKLSTWATWQHDGHRRQIERVAHRRPIERVEHRRQIERLEHMQKLDTHWWTRTPNDGCGGLAGGI